jgi:ethanolamine utilization protein EutN
VIADAKFTAENAESAEKGIGNACAQKLNSLTRSPRQLSGRQSLYIENLARDFLSRLIKVLCVLCGEYYMQLGNVVGHAVSSVKHATLIGWRLLIVQLLASDGKPDGEPLLAMDNLGAALGQRVVLSNDGLGARQLVGHKNSPVRWMVLGICDT